MRSTLIDEEDRRKTYAIVFDKGDEAASGLLEFAKRAGLAASQITAIGGFSRCTLGYFDRAGKEYLKIPVDEQVEVLSLVGDIAANDGKPQVHAHVVVGRANGETRGGHLLEAYVWLGLLA